MRDLILFGLSWLLAGPATPQQMCWTNTDNCSGIWRLHNTTAEPTCYILFRASGSTRNFCLAPNESATEPVMSGDSYCVEQNFTPPVNSCNRQYMAAYQ